MGFVAPPSGVPSRTVLNSMKPSGCALSALWLMLTAALLSCSSSSPLDCRKVSLDVCGRTPGCLLLEAHPVYLPEEPSMACALESQFVACGVALTCNVLAPSGAKDPAGREWVLLSPCVPEGWTQTAASAMVKACPICQSISLSACAGATYCQVAQARQIDREGTCLLPAQDVSCQPPASASVVFHRRIVDPSGTEWITSSNFIPPGWHDSTSRNTTLGDCATSDGGGDGGDAAAVDCGLLSIPACAATAGCRVLEGQEIVSQRSCVLPRKAVGCQRADVGCGDAFTRATDPGGKEWSFSSTCVPEGWTNVSGNNASFPECSAGAAATAL